MKIHQCKFLYESIRPLESFNHIFAFQRSAADHTECVHFNEGMNTMCSYKFISSSKYYHYWCNHSYCIVKQQQHHHQIKQHHLQIKQHHLQIKQIKKTKEKTNDLPSYEELFK